MNTRATLKGGAVAGAVALIAMALWLLYPPRQILPAGEENVVELTFMAPSGLTAPSSPFAGIMDAVWEFERQSRRAHARDSRHPIYRVIAGQYAAREMTSDPTRFILGVAGGEAPDVVYFDRFALPEWASRGAFLPLDPFIAKDLAAGRKDAPTPDRFYKATWNEATYQGRLYGIPGHVDSRALIYNRDLFQRAGLTHPPRDWDELKAYAVKLTQRDEHGRLTVVGFAPLFGNSWLYMFGFMADGRFMSPDGTRCTLHSPPIVRALTYMKDIYDAIAPGGYAEVAAFQAGFQGNELDPFIQGKMAMKIDMLEALVRAVQFSRDLNVAVAPPPLPRDQLARGRRTVTWIGGFAYALPVNARHREAAWEFIRFMSGERALSIMEQSQKELVEAQGRLFLPHQFSLICANEAFARKYIYDNPRVPPNIKDGCRVFNDLLNEARYRPVTPVGMLLWQEQIIAMDNTFYHKLSPRAALDQATAVVQRDLNERLHPVTGRPLSWRWFVLGYGLLLIAGAVVAYRRDRDKIPKRIWYEGLIAAGPWLVGFIVFSGGPMLFSLLISFSDYDILRPPQFTGLHNYRWMFTSDRLLPVALYNTLFMLIGVPLNIALSLALALLLNRKVRGIAVWRTFFYLPSIVPMVAASVLWIWILNPQGGLINLAPRAVGIEGPLWLQDPRWSKPAMILMGLWGAGANMIIWLAGLKGISEQLYEAAALDGANAWQQFWHVTIPQLTPYIFFNLVMGLIATFQIFGQAYIMTNGGPVNSTLFYVFHLFNNAFRYGHMGYGAALAWLLFVIVLGVTVLQLVLSKRWVHYESD